MEKENADELSSRSYTQSAGILERGGGRLLEVDEGDVGEGEEREMVGMGGGG